MCIVEIHEIDVISINRTVTKESQKKFARGRSNCLFYKFLILRGFRSRSQSVRRFSTFGMMTVLLDVRIA